MKPVYELDQNLKYKQMHDNGSFNYRANFDNRNKIIWNNTDFRLFNRDNPTSQQILPITETKFKPIKDKPWLNGYDTKLPE